MEIQNFIQPVKRGNNSASSPISLYVIVANFISAGPIFFSQLMTECVTSRSILF